MLVLVYEHLVAPGRASIVVVLRCPCATGADWECEWLGFVQCRLLPLEVASELDRLTGCREIVKNEALVMKSFDPDCHFVAEIGEMKISRISEKPFSDRVFASEGGYESDDEREEGEMIVGECHDDDDDDDLDSDQELETRNNE